jgi:hypothetical protein
MVERTWTRNASTLTGWASATPWASAAPAAVRAMAMLQTRVDMAFGKRIPSEIGLFAFFRCVGDPAQVLAGEFASTDIEDIL